MIFVGDFLIVINHQKDDCLKISVQRRFAAYAAPKPQVNVKQDRQAHLGDVRFFVFVRAFVVRFRKGVKILVVHLHGLKQPDNSVGILWVLTCHGVAAEEIAEFVRI